MLKEKTHVGTGLILVAEDSPEIRKVVEENILRPAGYEVRSVGDGMSALALAQEIEPDLVITDMQMPNLEGIELIRRLRMKRPHIPVILITSEGSEEVAIDALRAGASDYLTKPFEAEQLLAAVVRAEAEAKRRKENWLVQSEAEEGAENLERRVRELEALASIGQTVTGSLELDDVLTAVVEAAVGLTKSEEGSLLLIDEDTGQLYMRASKNFDEEFVNTFRLQVQDSLAGQVVASGEPVVLDTSSPQKIKTSYLVHSLIYVPLKVRGRTIGVLGVDNRSSGHELTAEDTQIMNAMADYAAIAIENARLYQASEAERLKFETVLTQTESGVILIDNEGQVIFVNRAARETFGVLTEDFVGRMPEEVFENETLLDLLLPDGTRPLYEEVELDEGQVFNAHRSPIEGLGVAVVFHDITHLKDLERKKSEFVTTVSHDLRSPLTAILGYTELIERAGELNDQQREFISRVQLSVKHITNLVSDLLDLGRIEAGLDAAKETTPVGGLAKYAVESLKGSAEIKQQTIEADLPDDLYSIEGSPIRLRQMVGNLIENAIKYTPEGGVVRIEGENEDGQVILRVHDSGPGIPPADQPYLFDKFYRGTNVSEDQDGTGLGLSIVKSIVDSHDGRIWVESQMGKGTTFTVVLPASPN